MPPKKNPVRRSKKEAVIMEEREPHWRNAIVIQANSKEFQPWETYHYAQVQSCFLVCCISGKGRIKVNDTLFDFTPGTVLYAPWNHAITYMPDPTDPFTSTGLHIVPDTDEHGEIIYNAFHSAQSDHPLYLMRHNEFIRNFNRAACRQYAEDSHFVHLIRYIVDRFEKRAGEEQLRLFARMVFFEIDDMLNGEETDRRAFPASFQNLLDIVEDNLELPFDLLTCTDRSEASVYRDFRKYLGVSPHRYLTRRRLEHAAMLLRDYSVSITDLARRLQFSTQGNFSRAFKAEFGVSPRRYRNDPDSAADPSRQTKRPPRRVDRQMITRFRPKFIPDSELP